MSDPKMPFDYVPPQFEVKVMTTDNRRELNLEYIDHLERWIVKLEQRIAALESTQRNHEGGK